MASDGNVRFSVIVPTHNRATQLRRCLTALSGLEYASKQFEVIVVNDGGTCADAVIDSFRNRIPLRSLVQDHRGPAVARNNGASQARGEFLIFLDDDCAPDPDWLRRWEESVERWPLHLMGGTTRNSLPFNLYSSATQYLLDFVHEYFNQEGRRAFVASCNLCVPAGNYRSIGGFSAEFPLAAAEDRDFSDLWLCNGWPIRLAKEPVVHHAHELDFTSFWRQHFHYEQGAFYFHRRTSGRRNEPVCIEPFAFYYSLILSPFHSETGISRAAALSMLIVVAQIANAAGFFVRRLGRDRRS